MNELQQVTRVKKLIETIVLLHVLEFEASKDFLAQLIVFRAALLMAQVIIESLPREKMSCLLPLGYRKKCPDMDMGV